MKKEKSMHSLHSAIQKVLGIFATHYLYKFSIYISIFCGNFNGLSLSLVDIVLDLPFGYFDLSQIW